MRTPGDDEALAAGFLMAEGIIHRSQDIEKFVPIKKANPPSGNQLEVHLSPGLSFDEQRMARNFYVSSSCGVCGKASIEAVRAQGLKPVESILKVKPDLLFEMPETLRRHQEAFQKTGGIHGAGLFDQNGQMLWVKEDVGRHNAVDKVIGTHFLKERDANQKHINASILVVSGRTSFELVQKAIFGRVPIVVAVGAPSSLAVDLAREFNVTLIGFGASNRFNVYSGRDRIDL